MSRKDPATMEDLLAADPAAATRSAVYAMLPGNPAAVLAFIGALRDDASEHFTRIDHSTSDEMRRYWRSLRRDALDLVYALEGAERIAVTLLENELPAYVPGSLAEQRGDYERP